MININKPANHPILKTFFIILTSNIKVITARTSSRMMIAANIGIRFIPNKTREASNAGFFVKKTINNVINKITMISKAIKTKM